MSTRKNPFEGLGREIEAMVTNDVSGVFMSTANILEEKLQESVARNYPNSTNDLLNSSQLTPPKKAINDQWIYSYTWNDYGDYQDAGVNGTEQSRGSQFSYTTKRPPIQPWLDKKLSKQSAFAITNSIFKKGFKGTRWITDVLTDATYTQMQQYLQDKLFTTV